MLGVGIIGFGRIGNEHAAWLRGCDSARPVAAADPTPVRRALAEASGLRVFDSAQSMLDDPAIDAVLVSSPTAMHRDHAVAALAAGKHVMIEKPMALDLAESKKIADAAAANHLTASVFHNRRWDIDFLTVKDAIASGIFGRVLNVESRLGQWSSCVGPAAPQYHPNWRNEAAFGGGGLYDWGSHFVDQIWRLLWPAKPLRVFAQLRGNVWTHDCDDFARLCIDFDNGAVGLVEINTTTTRPLPRWHIDGTAGSADSPFDLQFDLHTWSRLSFTSTNPKSHGGPEVLRRPASPGLSEVDIWNHFASAVNGHGAPAVPMQSVLPTMALLDAARQSSQSGTAVALPGDFLWSLE